MARPRIEIGTYGTIKLDEIRDEWHRARAYYRFSDGKLKQVERFDTTGPKAKARLVKALKTIDTGATGTMKATTRLRELARRFIDEKRDVGRSTSTLETYQFAADRIAETIGELTIAEATPERLQAYLTATNKAHGHGAAKNSRSVLSGMFGIAVRNGAVKENPVRELERISKRGKPGSEALPLEKLSVFLDVIRADKALVARDVPDVLEFLALTGWRIGEACGLEWRSVDFDKGEVTMRSIAVRVKGLGMILQPTGKTDAASRTVAMPARLSAMLKARRSSMKPNTLVFPTVAGEIRDPNNTERDWRERREELGFGGLTTHSLRKMVATALDDAGMSAREIADHLGHANPSVTQDVYMQRNRASSRAAQVLGDLFSESH